MAEHNNLMNNLKVCSKCGEEKPFEMYYLYKNGNVRSCCKKCFNSQSADYHRMKPAPYTGYDREKYNRMKEHLSEYRKKRYYANKTRLEELKPIEE